MRSQNKLGLPGKLAGMVLILGFIVLIPSIMLGAYSSLVEIKNSFTDYRYRVETRIQKGLEPSIWNYDLDSLREIISAELINDNLKSVRISTTEKDIMWLTSMEDGSIIDETENLEGKYYERHTIPIYRLDYKDRIIAYATVWYDLSVTRDMFFDRLKQEFILIIVMLLEISLLYIIISHYKLAKPLEAIKQGMIEAGKSSFDEARRKMNISNFKWAFSEIKGLHRDLENMFDEIKIANLKLWESEAEFRAIFHQAGIGVAQVRANGECIIANKKYADILGLTEKELKNLSFVDLTHEEDKDLQEEQFQKLFRGEIAEISIEKRYTRKDGKIVWVDLTVSPLYKPGETPTSHIAVIQDVSDKKIAEERLRRLMDELEERVVERTIDLENANCELEAALEDLHSVQTQLVNKEKMAVLGQLVAGIAHELNTPLGILKSAGGTLERIMQNELNDLVRFIKTAPEDTIKEYNELLRESVEAISYQDLSQKRELRRRYYAVNKEEVDAPNEIVEKLVDLGYDKDVDTYIKLVKNPENHAAIINAYNAATVYKSVKMITSSTERASKVITALKTYSHKDTNVQMVPHDVVADIEMVLTLFHNQTKYGIEVMREYDEVPKVMCIPDRLHQVWVNIINNAIQAMDYKGTLKINISQVDNRVRVSITDSGPGISDAVADRIFDPFFSTKELGVGTGLGLDIVKRILDEIDGSIDFQTKPGQTTFNIWLQAQKA